MIAPPDVEVAVVTLLDAGMTADVATRVPNRRTAEMVRVTSTGGSARNVVQFDARVLVECWGPDETTALDLARKAWALLWGAQDTYLDPTTYATRIESTGPVNFPDPDTTSPRFQFLSTLTVSMTEVAP